MGITENRLGFSLTGSRCWISRLADDSAELFLFFLAAYYACLSDTVVINCYTDAFGLCRI